MSNAALENHCFKQHSHRRLAAVKQFSILLLKIFLCLYPAVFLLNKDLCKLSDSRYPSSAKTVLFFLIEDIFMFWNDVEAMFTLVSLDKLQNISTLVRRSSKSEGKAF